MKGIIIANRYHVIRELGGGDFGSVLLAYDPSFHREVAVKIFAPQFNNIRQRIYREISIATKLEHNAIVPVYDIGEHDGLPYYVMRAMQMNLEGRLKNGPISPREANLILERISSALIKLHSHGIIHRNIKPTNILLDNDQLAYLSDFAMAHSTHTGTQAMIGTRTYMAPEQVTGDRLDERTDVYQLGALLFEMLTGQQPYYSNSPLAVAMMHLNGPIPSLLDVNSELAPVYQQVIDKAMAKNPEDRFVNTGEMASSFGLLLDAPSLVSLTDPVQNPFVVGNPVEGNLFVGRSEIFVRLKELWGNDTSLNVNSVVLFGHRRMGKTSILQNLGKGYPFGRNTLVANFNMQRAGRINNTGELLAYLAFAIFDCLDEAEISGVVEPELDNYNRNGYSAFNRFIHSVREIIAISPSTRHSIWGWIQAEVLTKHISIPSKRRPSRIIVAIDEFELIESAIENGLVDKEILDFLRGIIHSESWLILALAGLHTLEEMTADYWNPLYASVTPVRVSFLSRNAIANLLTNPVEGFPLKFTNAAIDHIYDLTKGQPYLTQLIAHSLVSDYNQTVFEGGKLRSHRFSPADVDNVIASTMFYEQGNYYFAGVWGQAENSGPQGQITLLKTLASSNLLLDKEELAEETQLLPEAFEQSLEVLCQHDVLKVVDKYPDFTVPLMRRWIQDVKL